MSKNNHISISGEKYVFVTLNALRGLAAISIVVYHYHEYLTNVWFPLHGYLAVDFFFMLSGFVIAHAYDKRLESGMDLWDFLRRRLIRLYPLFGLAYIAGFCGYAAKSLWADPLFDTRIIYSFLLGMFMLPTPKSLAPDYGVFPLNGPSWSLSLEMAINILYAANYKRLRGKILPLLLPAAGVALIIIVQPHHDLNMGSSVKTYAGGVARMLWSFPAGILLYRIYIRKNPASLPGWMGLCLSLFFVALFFFPVKGTMVGLVNVFIFFPVILWLGARVELKGALAQRIAGWLGDISYPLYLIHFGTMFTFNAIYKWLGFADKTHILFRLVFATLLAIAVSWFLAVIYDIPLRRYLTERWNSAAGSPARNKNLNTG